MLADLGRSPRTVEAYARGVVDFLEFCQRAGVDVTGASRADVAGYVRDLRSRPGRGGGNVVAIDSGAGLSNGTLRSRLVAVRLFYDFLVEERVVDRNPVGRGRYGAGTGVAAAVAASGGWSRCSPGCRGSRPTRSGGRCSRLPRRVRCAFG